MFNDVTNCYHCKNPIFEWENRVANLSDRSHFIIPKFEECHTKCYFDLIREDSLQPNSVYGSCGKCNELLVKDISYKRHDDYYHLACYVLLKKREFLNDPKNKEK